MQRAIEITGYNSNNQAVGLAQLDLSTNSWTVVFRDSLEAFGVWSELEVILLLRQKGSVRSVATAWTESNSLGIENWKNSDRN